VLLVAGLGFKIASIPFHMWVPDVYEGAPTPITAYLSVASKAAGFAIILRVFYTAFGLPEWLSISWGMIFAVLSGFTMTLGNVVAILQENIKRMLGYSSIAHAGYIMVGLAALGMAHSPEPFSRSAILFFLASYALANLGAFITIIAITNKTGSDLIQDFSGMAKRAPVLSLVLTLCLISLTGIPPTAGFIAKVYIFNAGVHYGLLWLVIVAVINTAISVYYYLRVVKVMYLGEALSYEKVPSSAPLRATLVITSLGILLLGIYPYALLRFAEIAIMLFP
jgi:NADH-quinone oxidoreductase subunit N